MTNNLRDVWGPGEHAEPANGPAEAHIGRIPDGEMPAVEPGIDPRRCTQEMKPAHRCEDNVASDHDTRSTKHRTGTDHDDLRAVQPQDDATEQRLDRSAHDLPRENTFDSVPDDAGPLSDTL